ncbi:MAG: hypothetical protein HY731_01080, partial [Candidatus Tectomicrobia bacterium]|nr:hypothetical protein [Candidatus Tectomicrobia bacterium]
LSRNPWKTFVSGLTSFSFMPIYAVLGTGGAGLAVAALLLTLAMVAPLISSGMASQLWIYGVLTFFWASLMIAVGTVGIYVARTYKDVRNRPRYIVREMIGFETTMKEM